MLKNKLKPSLAVGAHAVQAAADAGRIVEAAAAPAEAPLIVGIPAQAVDSQVVASAAVVEAPANSPVANQPEKAVSVRRGRPPKKEAQLVASDDKTPLTMRLDSDMRKNLVSVLVARIAETGKVISVQDLIKEAVQEFIKKNLKGASV